MVEPKKKRLDAAKKQLAEKQASLREAKEKLREVKEKLEQLQKEYQDRLANKDDLRKKAELTELKLDRAAKLVAGLAGERVRWEQSVKVRGGGGGISCFISSSIVDMFWQNSIMAWWRGVVWAGSVSTAKDSESISTSKENLH